MANSSLVFTPEDFDAVVTYDYLVEHLRDIIISIRQNDYSGIELRTAIEHLDQLSKKGDIAEANDSNISFLFSIYEQIKIVSMKIRQLLSTFINLNTYDNIGYVFYYNGQRYVTETIQQSWLISGSKGSLSLNLEKAAEDLKSQYSNSLENKIRSIFNQHYATYLQAIAGMYEYPLGARIKGAKLNKGHVAEAYESHLAEHHKVAYNLLNNFSIDSPATKAIVAQLTDELGADYWAKHETPTEAWIHVRGALGTQRGTVAGDVGRFQVKQGSNSSVYGAQVRLSSIANLRRGVNNYCAIINPDIDATVVARQLATYLSERIGQPSKDLQAYIANKEFQGDLNNLSLKRIVHI